MRPHLLLIAGGASLLLASGLAQAGPCSDEIAMLEKQLSSKDAGMGPVDTGMAESSQSADAGTADTPTAGEVPGTEATPAMNEVTEGIATSPQDVQQQNTGQPTASEAAQAGEMAPAAGQSDVTDHLQQAREYDAAGKEAECMTSVTQAKRQLGIQ
ncbi:MAG: hypothetical protein BroJett029_37250 [Alphaproteobacteria bacterium]|nr:MAG: hypothetical protein BroJett029_37250 [Alphaproteobacteria bacterium]